MTSATEEPETSFRWGKGVQDSGFRTIEGQSFNLFPNSTTQCGYMDAALGIPKLPVTVSIDELDQDYLLMSDSQCFSYRLGQKMTYYCLPDRGTTQIPVAANNKIGVTVTTSNTKESEGRWNGYTFTVQVDGTGK